MRNKDDGSPHSSPYCEKALAEMTRLLSRAAKRKTICSTNLHSELLEISHAINGPISPELAAAWNVPQADARSRHESAILFEEAAASPDPLASFAPSDVEFTRLNKSVRLQWAKTWNKAKRPESLRGIEWTSLPAAAQEEVRDACRSLAVRERALAGPGRPSRKDLTTHLLQLAELFIQLTGSPKAEWQLSSDPKSQFIRFATLAILPFSTESSANPGALSTRWRDHVCRPGRAAKSELESEDTTD